MRVLLLLFLGLCIPYATAQAEVQPQVQMPQVKLVTSMGDITLEVDVRNAPISAENFLNYVRDGFYNGTIFHRVIDGFMLQGGGFDESMKKKTTREPITNEATNARKNLRGTIAMARTGDPHSATAQFFINLIDNSFLDHTGQTQRGWGYAVFAHVVGGMEVVEQIAAVATGNYQRFQNVPTTAVVIKSATVVGE
ncbi:MAG: peptidyl-prolyl cis-trans isomerase B (cyclophilin B) [Gammaproteobacteria bacterium]|jgi:peptidyl-prolyl cis-trans isomerase B (cyclophilin B)